MASKQAKFLVDNCHLSIPCHFSSKSRCSLKSHSSSCLCNPYENQIFEGSGPYSKDDEFPTLLTPSPANEDTKHSPKKKKKKLFTVDVSVPSTRVVYKHHRCRLHRDKGSGRQRLHSDSSGRTKRDSEGGGSGVEQSKRARLAVVAVALVLILLSVFLVGITLRMAPVIDELVRKENEDIYRAMSAGPTPPPGSDNANVNVANSTATGQPG